MMPASPPRCGTSLVLGGALQPRRLTPCRSFVSCAAAAVGDDGFVYVLGNTGRAAMMARIPTSAFAAAQYDQLRYWTGSVWAPFSALDVTPAAPLFDFVPSETTLFFHPVTRFWYIVVANTFISNSIYLVTAPAPEGPWMTVNDVYPIPPERLVGKVFCYAGKAHPELTAPGSLEIVFSYVCNTPAIDDLLDRLDIYVPQLVRVTITP